GPGRFQQWRRRHVRPLRSLGRRTLSGRAALRIDAGSHEIATRFEDDRPGRGAAGIVVTPSANPTVVCTLGMHRSGTSLGSRLRNLLGVYLGGSQSIAGAGEDNPRGHWEHQPLKQINDDILSAFGGRWDAPPTLPHLWLREPCLDALRLQARAVLTSEFAAQT